MKLAVLCFPSVGGSGVVATEQARFLAERGLEVHLVSTEAPFRLPEQEVAGLTFHRAEPPEYPLFQRHPLTMLTVAVTVARLLELRGLQVIHAHYALPFGLAGHLARKMVRQGAALVTTVHGTDITHMGRDPQFRRAVEYALRVSDRLIAVSRYLKKRLTEEFAVEHVEVVPNFVDVRRFSPGSGLPELRALRAQGVPVLVHVSNFRAVKRPEDCVEILALVRKHFPAVLVLVGEGPELPRVVARARQLGLEQAVRLYGVRPYPVSVLREADLFLFPSADEGFGLAALEAQACGVPVVGTMAGGLPEVVQHGETGFLHPVGAVPAMAESALQLLADARLREQMGRRARERAVRVFAPEVVGERLLRVYEALRS